MDINKISLFVFDFDGVLTDNFVYVNENGQESVKCSRSDGLAFDALKKLKIPCIILSTETNKVVRSRAKKLGIEADQGSSDKLEDLTNISEKLQIPLNKIFYVGNDLNDFHAMKMCGYSACPADSHPKIRSISDYSLNRKGGDGIIRELLESVFNIDLMELLN